MFGFELVAAGLLVGICVGVTGVGSGSLMAPLLILVFKIDPLVAVGSDLLYSAPTKIVGSLMHARQRTVDSRVTVALSAGGLIGIAAGWLLVAHVRAAMDPATLAETVKHWVGLAVFASAVLTIVSTFVYRIPFADEDPTRYSRVAVGVLGFFVGVTVMTTSVGAGAITMPFLRLLLRSHRTQLLVGSDLSFSAVIATVAAALAFGSKNVNVGVSLLMLLGSIPGVIVGSRFMRYVPDTWLKFGVGALLIVIGLRMA